MSQTKTEIKNLPTRITFEEAKQYGMDLLAALERSDELEQRRKTEMERIKSMQTENDGRLGQLRVILRSGEHYRDIICDIKINETDMTEEAYRTDTWERVNVRGMTAAEIASHKQGVLIDPEARHENEKI